MEKVNDLQIKGGNCFKRSREVEDLNGILAIADKMIPMCKSPLGRHSSGALAIAHCQVEREDPLRFFVTLDGEVIINPTIESMSDPFHHMEGCMSFAFRGMKKVRRYRDLTVRYTNREGECVTEDVDGLRACIFQHEIDHMNGKSIF